MATETQIESKPHAVQASGSNGKPPAVVGSTDLLAALRMQMHQLEMTVRYGGPSEICGALDAVDNAVDELRNKVSG